MSVGNRQLGKESGFTLVELLVVIAIIGILVALLLPAIQAAREAARRAQCQSNMKNISLAVLNYESSNKKFPPGFVSSPSSTEAWGWAAFTLPYLEEQGIYDRLSPSPTYIGPVDGTRKGRRNLADAFVAASSSATELAPLQTAIAVFRCPTDTTPALVPCDQPGGACSGGYAGYTVTTDTGLWFRSFISTNSGKITPRFLPPAANYVGNRGTIDTGCPGTANGSSWTPNQAVCDSNGVFFGNSQVSSKQITDGTSKTFMVGERDHYCLSATWIGGRETVDGSEMHSTLWTLAHVWVPLNDPETLAYNTCTEGFSSSHKGGGFFAYCDGSVHFISDDIDNSPGPLTQACLAGHDPLLGCKSRQLTKVIGTYQRLAWRDDGEVIDEF
jgi:prepilin-type N-terminal cleavage/methylation domain-containing protein